MVLPAAVITGTVCQPDCSLAMIVSGSYFLSMRTTIEAIYENGVLKLPASLPLPEKSHVIVTIQSTTPTEDFERAAWLKLSEERLLKAWENPDDDIFNELLQK
jgi:predicted DNA-binding antitoxin AbrB/MazE fold protein